MQIVEASGAQFEIEQTGRGPDFVLLHSLLTDPGSFARIVPALSRGRRVTLVSLPGFGRSSPAGPSIEDSADRVAVLVATLGGKPDVLGNGYGGVVPGAAPPPARAGGRPTLPRGTPGPRPPGGAAPPPRP